MSVVLFEIKNNIAFITFNRPEKYNALNRSMALLCQGYLQSAGSDESVRCIVITGSGKAFCSGQDIEEIIDPEGPAIGQILDEHFNPIIKMIRAISKPVIAAINGVAAGAGANIALSCDITLAASSAVFIQAFSKIGLIPDSGGTFFLPRLIGLQKATALMMLGEKMSAPDAEKCGMIYKVYEDTDFQQSCLQLAETIASLPPVALALTKQALNASLNNVLDEQLKLEDVLQQQAGSTLDFKEGIAAFMQKRKPVFTGK